MKTKIMLILAIAAVCQSLLLAANPTTLSVTMTPAPNVTITGDPGNYTLEYASVLGGGQTNWVALANVTVAGTTTNWVDSSGVGQARRFYRTVAGTNNPNPALFVWVPPGTFVMGSPASETERYSDEVQHTVTLTMGFYMGKYAVTQGQYLAVAGNNPSYFTTNDYNGNPISPDLNRPVETVSWNDATNYCALLTRSDRAAGRIPSGWGYRLPAEAEWEYACRAGTTTAFHFGSAVHGGMANFYDYYEYDAAIGEIYVANPSVPWLRRTTTVGSYAPNAFGLYDMHGNVWEWCQDWYGAYPTGSVTDPQGPASGSLRVIRGGCWNYNGRDCRSAFRRDSLPTYRSGIMGFRVVLAPGQP